MLPDKEARMSTIKDAIARQQHHARSIDGFARDAAGRAPRRARSHRHQEVVRPGCLRRATEAEHFLAGRTASDETFREAAEIALASAAAREHNRFTIELAKQTIVRAFATTRDAERRFA